MISRQIQAGILEKLFKGKAVLIFGARQVGKTTLVHQIISSITEPHILLNGDEADVREIMGNTTSGRLKAYFGGKNLIILDEAQRIPNVGLTLKLITDQLTGVQVIATGSSAFELADLIKEPLTGRKYEFRLYPISFQEMVDHHGLIEEKRLLEHRLIYGAYPEMITRLGEEKELLILLAGSYLYKDILMLENIKKPVLLEKILKALALQLGSEVSYHEISRLVGSNSETVEKYIDILEKAFIIFKLTSFSRNVRNEIAKGKKIYFYDVGIRNSVMGNYNAVSSRTDIGALWENYIISERKKFLHNKGIERDCFFWRTTQQQEIDYIEDVDGVLHCYEIKWNPKKKMGISKSFTRAYPDSEAMVINRDNYFEFLTG